MGYNAILKWLPNRSTSRGNPPPLDVKKSGQADRATSLTPRATLPKKRSASGCKRRNPQETNTRTGEVTQAFEIVAWLKEGWDSGGSVCFSKNMLVGQSPGEPRARISAQDTPNIHSFFLPFFLSSFLFLLSFFCLLSSVFCLLSSFFSLLSSFSAVGWKQFPALREPREARGWGRRTGRRGNWRPERRRLKACARGSKCEGDDEGRRRLSDARPMFAI